VSGKIEEEFEKLAGGIRDSMVQPICRPSQRKRTPVVSVP
jgi:hypothetical protein